MFNKARLLSLLAAAFFGGCASQTSVEQISNALQRPNIVLIVTDDQGKGDVGVYQNPVIQTPHLDALHGQSAHLENFHVDPTCSPTRAALLTGQQSIHAGVWHTIMGRNILPTEKVTLAEILKQNGYDTAHFGKWHLGDNYPFRPQDQGFDLSIMHGAGGVGQTPDHWGNTQFGDTYYVNGEPKSFAGNSTDVWFDEAETYISNRIEEQKSAKSPTPFFTYIATNAPHSPYRAPDKYMNMYKDAKLPNTVHRFYAMVTHIDERVGQLRDLLIETGTERDTIFIFMTDNGSSLRAEAAIKKQSKAFSAAGQPVPDAWRDWTHNAGLSDFKASVKEGGHRVPFFIRWPAKGIEDGRAIDTLSAHFDVVPTLVDWLNLELPANTHFDGASIADAIEGKTTTPERTLVVTNQRVAHPSPDRPTVVMTDTWRYFPANGELYNVKTDLAQLNNVAATNADVVNSLHSHFEQWWKTESNRLADFPRMIIGSDKEPVSRLTSHDFTPLEGQDTIKVAWFPGFAEASYGEYKSAWLGHEQDYQPGFLNLEAAQSGDYVFDLYYHDAPAAKTIPFKYAHIEIDGQRMTKPVIAETSSIRFKMPIDKGKLKLVAWFSNDELTNKKDGTPAFFIYAQRAQ